MNSAEKKVVYMAVAFLVVGVVVRFLPWGVPSIEQLVDLPAQEPAVSESRASLPDVRENALTEEITDKVISEGDGGAAPAKRRKKARKKPKIVRLPIGINKAGLDELCALKGVGPKLAERIIAYREQKGPFLTPSDLEKVPGIGKKKLEGILQGIIFD